MEIARQPLEVGGILFVDVSGPTSGAHSNDSAPGSAAGSRNCPNDAARSTTPGSTSRAPRGRRNPWVEEYDLDITAHVRRVDVDHPGDDRAVFELCGTLFIRPLDRSRPQWERWVLERLTQPDTIVV